MKRHRAGVLGEGVKGFIASMKRTPWLGVLKNECNESSGSFGASAWALWQAGQKGPQPFADFVDSQVVQMRAPAHDRLAFIFNCSGSFALHSGIFKVGVTVITNNWLTPKIDDFLKRKGTL